MSTSSPPSARARLEGWKAIAGHLGIKERNAQRWEHDLGLPIHREGRQKRAAVFAFTEELELWRRALEARPRVATIKPLRNATSRAGILVTLVIAGSAVLALALPFVLTHDSNPEPPAPFGRLFVRSSSEGREPTRIKLKHPALLLEVSRDGKKLFAADAESSNLSIVTTSDWSVQTITLPHEATSLASSKDGMLYIGSRVEGVMVVDTARVPFLRNTITTGGPVWDLAITPDGEKLFLAMSYAGLKRLSTRTGAVDRVSNQICPEYVGIDPPGRNLYVSYQCSGLNGRAGHNSVEIFDVGKEVSLGVVSGPPMVGGGFSFSVDGELILLDGRDACEENQYDHAGCPSVPSRVFQLFRPSDRRFLWTFAFPVGMGVSKSGFLDQSRFLTIGQSVSVIDATKYTTLERWGGEGRGGPSVFDSARHIAYLGVQEDNSILRFEGEGPECSPPAAGLTMYYPADGSTDDAAGITALKAKGGVRFAPGKVGQAFFLDGTGFLSETWTGHYKFLSQESAVALYVKTAIVGEEEVMIDWTNENPQAGIRLIKSLDDRFVFQAWPGGSSLTSRTLAKPGVWYHIVVTRTDHNLTLYVNGEPEVQTSAPIRFDDHQQHSLLLGARSPGQPAFHGWLDEIAFYNRALNAAEIRKLYQLRESGPCKLSL
jgi:hypothetical protein